MSVVFTTLNIAFSIAYYLELCNAMIIECTSFFFLANEGQIGCLDIIEHLTSLLGKIYIYSKKRI